MKKISIIILSIFFWFMFFPAGRARAESFAPWIGFEKPALSEIDRDLSGRPLPGATSITKVSPGSAITMGIDSRLFRFGYTGMPKLKVSWNDLSGARSEVQVSPQLLMFETGLKIPFIFNIELYGGAGLGIYDEKQITSGEPGGSSMDIMAVGMNSIIEASLGIELARFLELGLGYRYCRVDPLKSISDATNLMTGQAVHNGDIIKQVNGENMALDYSEWTIKLTFHFGHLKKKMEDMGDAGAVTPPEAEETGEEALASNNSANNTAGPYNGDSREEIRKEF